MGQCLIRIKTTENQKLSDDGFVSECMLKLQEEYPQIEGYLFERVDEECIQIMVYGENFYVES